MGRVKDITKAGRTLSPGKVVQDVTYKGESDIKLTLRDLLRVVNKRKKLLGTSMGEMRRTRVTSVKQDEQKGTIVFWGISKGTVKYTLRAKFHNVSFSESKDIRHPITLATRGEPEKFMSRIRSDKNPVKLKCTCEDFNWSFSYWDKQEKVLFGRVPAKVKNYKNQHVRPSRNPGHLPGFCKHQLAFVKRLRQEGYIS